MKKLFVIWTLVLTQLVMLGCGSASISVQNQDKSLGEIRNAISSISGEPRFVSENKREIISQYFSRNGKDDFDWQKSKERLYAKFTILGERRPYDIDVQVFVEKKFENNFESLGEDEQMSHKIAKELQNKLNQSRDNRNVIDDFRPF